MGGGIVFTEKEGCVEDTEKEDVLRTLDTCLWTVPCEDTCSTCWLYHREGVQFIEGRLEDEMGKEKTTITFITFTFSSAGSGGVGNRKRTF